jgi:hypothetical protein
VTLPYGTPKRGLVARVIYSAASNASGSNSVTFSVDYSSDGGSTWGVLAQAQPLALSTTAATGEIYIPFISPVGAPSNAQFRLTATIAGGGSTPTITYSGDLGDAFP